MIYFDNAATTKCDKKIAEIISKYLTDDYFNPSAKYHEGISAKKEINNARENFLRLLNGTDGNFIFTSSGSESDNMAILGAKKRKNSKIITTKAEHSAVYQTVLGLSDYEIFFVNVDKHGKVIESELEKAVDENTSLISIMHVNNETGAVNDIKRLNLLAKNKNPNVIFHSDGVQALGKMPLNLRDLGVDLYSVGGHKIHSPKGIGGLYIKKGINLKPLIFGGGQEFNLRSSTENTAFIKAFEYSVELAVKDLEKNQLHCKEIKNNILNALKGLNLEVISPENGVDNILTLTSAKVRGEVMQHALEKYGILIGTGSACSSNKASARIPQSLGLKGNYADGIIRLSFSKYNTIDEGREFIEKFIQTYKELEKYVSL